LNSIIPFPTDLRPALPTIVGNVDYLQFRERLEQIDRILLDSGLETAFVEECLKDWPRQGQATAREQQKFQQRAARALRCNLLRTLLQEDFRCFSCQLAGNPLHQWFCGIDALDKVRVPSKSELQRFAGMQQAPQLRSLIDQLLQTAVQKPLEVHLAEPLNLDDYFLDTTCLKANIHYPVDWVLLRDGTRTLMKAVALIRGEGLKGRMEPPEAFLSRINRLSIAMTQTGRRSQSKKERKRVLRKIKKLVKVVENHARRHRDLLDEQWAETSWTRPQAEQVLRRIDGVLELLPKAQKQAHERIIGERPVENAEKLLSLYETDTRVLVRGKAGAEVEFGNTLLLAENGQGLILDFKLYQEQAPGDSHLLLESLERLPVAVAQAIKAVGTDRGFSSRANTAGLEAAAKFNGICPKSPEELKERLKEERFVALQRRRSQTEARISILQRGFLGKPMRAKGFEHREVAVAWGVLTHNLWVLARLGRSKPEKAARAA
jgi:hypothetical protein